MDEMLADLKVLGKREISNVLKWRSKIAQRDHVKEQKEGSSKVKKAEKHVEEDEIQELSDHEDEKAMGDEEYDENNDVDLKQDE
jgi:AdoMet-dependent rRNA methyltransferase SPB1